MEIFKLKPRTPKMAIMIQSGRIELVALSLPGNIALTVANAYGWTTCHTDPVAIARTRDLISAIVAEFNAVPHGPKMLVGDLNCELSDIVDLEAIFDAIVRSRAHHLAVINFNLTDR